MFNFENLLELDISCNWFGVDGLHEIQNEFLKFKQLKVLKLATNKLCFGPPDDLNFARKLASVILKLG